MHLISNLCKDFSTSSMSSTFGTGVESGVVVQQPISKSSQCVLEAERSEPLKSPIEKYNR